jgi:hypothetical protein
VRIEHCPTADMVADYFTKPLLQGAAFRKLCDLIMNIDPSSKYHPSNSVPRSVLSTEVTPDSSCNVSKPATLAPHTFKEALVGSQPSVL